VVSAAGSNFNGPGQFKFALVNSNGTATFWSNDESSVDGSEPSLAVAAPVNQGLFTVLLGDTSLSNMALVPWSVFTNSDVRLRVWFGQGTNLVLLAPDQRFTSVGYAMMAAGVAPGAVASAQLAVGAVASENIAAGAITGAQMAVNSVGATAIQNGAIIAAKLAPQAVTTPA